MKLETTDTELHALQEIEDGARAGSTMVKVPREALRHLLRDHFTLFTAATTSPSRGGMGHKVEAGDDQRSLA